MSVPYRATSERIGIALTCCALLSVIYSGALFAQDWVHVATTADNEAKFFVDANNIRIKDGRVLYWRKSVDLTYNEQRASQKSIDQFVLALSDTGASDESVRAIKEPRVKERVTYVSGDCGTYMMAGLHQISYDADGGVVFRDTLSEEMSPVAPGTVGEAELEFVCELMGL